MGVLYQTTHQHRRQHDQHRRTAHCASTRTWTCRTCHVDFTLSLTLQHQRLQMHVKALAHQQQSQPFHRTDLSVECVRKTPYHSDSN